MVSRGFINQWFTSKYRNFYDCYLGFLFNGSFPRCVELLNYWCIRVLCWTLQYLQWPVIDLIKICLSRLISFPIIEAWDLQQSKCFPGGELHSWLGTWFDSPWVHTPLSEVHILTWSGFCSRFEYTLVCAAGCVSSGFHSSISLLFLMSIAYHTLLIS